MKSNFLLTILLICGCNFNPNIIDFSSINQNGEISQISKSVTTAEIKDYLNTTKSATYKKLILTQSNGDNLILEQNNEGEYLVLLKIRYEQFAIRKRPKTTAEVTEIMCRYLYERDGIMKDVKFY